MAKPPRITRLKVENYRTLRSLEIDNLSPFTVLVGPNGSGKSTFFDVFAFLSDCFTDGVRRACDNRGGIAEMRSRGTDGPVTVEITYESLVRLNDRSSRRKLTYHLSLGEDSGRPVVERELLRWNSSPGPGRPTHVIDFERGAGKIADQESGIKEERGLSQPDLLAVSALGQFRNHPRVMALKDFVSGWYMSYLNVEDERRTPVAGPQERLSKTGDNLTNVLQYLQENHPERLEHIIGQLKEAVPGLGEVTYKSSPDGRLVLLVRDQEFERPVLARYVSDGTLKMLSYLVVLADPDPSPFIGIEEPENFLYPSLLPGLAARCRGAAQKSQVLVTTHSTEFVGACQPEEVLALYRGQDGYTRVTRPSESETVQSMMESGAQMGWLWESGFFDLPEPTTVASEYGG
ncbi:AAA family ATPase [Streptomonospora nanhaiensis]|uniref:AAA family ATPase n=1 Tax=Streptomonospora nanhaiensis TaxID=1323731 RepID=A0ABY6YIJ7_9ACTN|nr:AAA family ATPase [Streptomonospora nanhaiensis]WAE72033.1 AAA family ATPase [Streptomonospora nanhaiensis]